MKVRALAIEDICCADQLRKNTILRALNNIHTHALTLPPDDPHLRVFFEYVVGLCDVLVLYIDSKHTIPVSIVRHR
jgi:hypothetical protein